jgi:hypothetical protein
LKLFEPEYEFPVGSLQTHHSVLELLNRLGMLLQPIFESSTSTVRLPRFGPGEVVVHGCESFLDPIAEAAGFAGVLGPQSFQVALDVPDSVLDAGDAPHQFSAAPHAPRNGCGGLSAGAPGRFPQNKTCRETEQNRDQRFSHHEFAPDVRQL